MGESNKFAEKRVLTEELISKVDAVYDSPQTRASAIWDVIQKQGVTDWDTVCFAAEALGLLSARYSYLTEAAKAVLRLVYHAHYFYPENFNARVGEFTHSDRRAIDSRQSEGHSTRADAPRSLYQEQRSRTEESLHVQDNRDSAANERTSDVATDGDRRDGING